MILRKSINKMKQLIFRREGQSIDKLFRIFVTRKPPPRF